MNTTFYNTDSKEFWNSEYESRKTGWDLNSPNPVFKYLITDVTFIKPSKIIILGSGKGFDAVLAYEKGYDVTTVDFATNANEYCKELSEKFNSKLSIIEKDFFELDSSIFNSFDIVYEYVTYCAISITRRNDFLRLAAKLLKPGGRFVTDLFPIDKREDGPPFSVDLSEFLIDAKKFFNLEYLNKNVPSVKPRRGKEILLVFRKPFNVE
jgi:SAM-dependent methyltransferase